MAEPGMMGTIGPVRAGRPRALGVAALTAMSAVAVGFLSLLPSDVAEPAFIGLVVLGLAGGAWTESTVELLLFVVGGILGALLVGLVTLGGPTGPRSTDSLVVGSVMVAVTLGAAAAIGHWLARFEARMQQAGRDDVPSGAVPTADRRELPSGAPRASASRRAQWRLIRITFGVGLVMLATALAIAWGGRIVGP